MPAKLPAKEHKVRTRVVLKKFTGVIRKVANYRAKKRRRGSPIPTLASKQLT